MTTRDLELVVLGILLADPSKRPNVQATARSILSKISNGDATHLRLFLGNVKVEPGKTADNVIAEWNRRVEADAEVERVTAALFEAKANRWKIPNT